MGIREAEQRISCNPLQFAVVARFTRPSVNGVVKNKSCERATATDWLGHKVGSQIRKVREVSGFCDFRGLLASGAKFARWRGGWALCGQDAVSSFCYVSRGASDRAGQRKMLVQVSPLTCTCQALNPCRSADPFYFAQVNTDHYAKVIEWALF